MPLIYIPLKLTNNLHLSLQSSGKKAPTRYDKHVRAFAEKKKFSKAQRAVTISIEGRNMALWFNITVTSHYCENIQQESRHFSFSCEKNWKLKEIYCIRLPICEIVKLWVAMGNDLANPGNENRSLELSWLQECFLQCFLCIEVKYHQSHRL